MREVTGLQVRLRSGLTLLGLLYLYVTPEDGRVRLEVAVIESPCAVLGGTLDTCLRPHGSHHLLVYANLVLLLQSPALHPQAKQNSSHQP